MIKLSNFNQNYLIKNDDTNKFCLAAMPQIFPDQNQVNQLVSQANQLKVSQIKIKNVYTPQYLLFHTRDQAWLFNYVYRMIYPNEPQQAGYVQKVQALMETPYFVKCCRDFEQRMIKAFVAEKLKDKTVFQTSEHLYTAFQGDFERYLRQSVITLAHLFGLDRATALNGLKEIKSEQQAVHHQSASVSNYSHGINL